MEHYSERISQGTTKMAVKRTTSDPGQRVQLNYQATTQPSGNQQQQTQTQLQPSVTDSFPITGYSEDGGYFSPSLQDEVFQQVTAVPDSVLLHATQLDSIQVSIIATLDPFRHFDISRYIVLSVSFRLRVYSTSSPQNSCRKYLWRIVSRASIP